MLDELWSLTQACWAQNPWDGPFIKEVTRKMAIIANIEADDDDDDAVDYLADEVNAVTLNANPPAVSSDAIFASQSSRRTPTTISPTRRTVSSIPPVPEPEPLPARTASSGRRPFFGPSIPPPLIDIPTPPADSNRPSLTRTYTPLPGLRTLSVETVGPNESVYSPGDKLIGRSTELQATKQPAVRRNPADTLFDPTITRRLRGHGQDWVAKRDEDPWH
ncbi:hypothetical protein EUX98_g3122 [Antrodiella citrinella]|uniref:Uncharacterized protein n=1 Tax=Antrodiella citrinella TaxID=2447956 RepID=A0A4S4MZH6_9APHY|nr:hypothetical protein EUX98_g3122 [Antrodiella citrinella]